MKPAWDTLIAEYQNSSGILVADVDCTQKLGKPLCQQHGIKGFPTLKYGDPSALQDYKGGRGLPEMRKFAATLKPACSAMNVEACGDAEKAKIVGFSAMSSSDREAMIKEKDAQIEKAQKEAQAVGNRVDEQIEEAKEKKDAALKAIKSSGLSLLYAVHRHEKSSDL